MDFSQSVAVITGAGSGIGQQLAIQLAQAGAKVAINDFNAESLEQTAEEVRSHGGTVFSDAFDVSNREAMHNFAQMVEEQFGQVDMMINNAGVALGRMKLEEISYEDFQWLLNINLWGVIHGTVAFLPLLRQRPRAKLVNVCSSYGLLAVPEQSPYCTAKFAVRGFTDSLRLELMDTNVRVSLVCPSQVRTNIVRHGRHRTEAEKEKTIEQFDTLMTCLSPADGARIILRGLRKNRELIFVGRDSKIYNFASRFTPQCIIKFVVRRELRKLAELDARSADSTP